MGVELTFAMATESSASLRVQTMLLPFDDQYHDTWSEDGAETYLVLRVPEARVESVIHKVSRCHPTVQHVDQVALTPSPTDFGSTPTTG
jgi:hypothetical protein